MITQEFVRTRVLESLSWQGPMSVTEMAASLDISETRVRSAVARLHDEDLVEQLNSTNAIQLTNKG